MCKWTPKAKPDILFCVAATRQSAAIPNEDGFLPKAATTFLSISVNHCQLAAAE
jgi:hypothetical protein